MRAAHHHPIFLAVMPPGSGADETVVQPTKYFRRESCVLDFLFKFVVANPVQFFQISASLFLFFLDYFFFVLFVPS